MRLINLTAFAFLFVFVSCNSQKSVISVLKNIYEEDIKFYKDKKTRNKKKLAYSIRKKLAKGGKLDFISANYPLYILEGYDLETDENYVSIWNEVKGVSYVENNENAYKFSNEIYISKEAKKIFEKWDIEKIKYQQKKNGILLGNLNILVQKIWFDDKGNISDTKRFSFEEYGDFFKEIELKDSQ